MWKKAKGLIRPLDAPMAGYEKENVVFIARTNFKDGVHPCKFVDNYGCYVSYSGKEYKVDDFEYYAGTVKWVKCSNHQIPNGAIVAGQESDGRKLYIGRTEYQNMLITGKVGTHLARAQNELCKTIKLTTIANVIISQKRQK